MGLQTALGISESGLDLDKQIAWHLQTNHYPRIPTTMVEPCIKAIELANEGEWEAEVELPEGCFYKGSTTASVRVMVEQHHLDAWITE